MSINVEISVLNLNLFLKKWLIRNVFPQIFRGTSNYIDVRNIREKKNRA